ncbi:MAG: hypothetical protein JWM87_99 [Candidatus Eremiobacteraeota bacterium]|nr:hypothetical protein [Candidatus Eremiobacteraeota bacterium]
MLSKCALVAVVLLQHAMGGPFAGWRHVLPLGIDLVSFDVPAGLLVLRKAELEHGEFDIRRVHGGRLMHVVIDGGLENTAVGEPIESYCLNGIHGVTNLKAGTRKILLHLPPDSNEYAFFFEFKEMDATARAILRTFHVRGVAARC